ncbi:colicin V family bacteriocin [Klebsiella aerogenes]|uniref:colicin V family bacteriocin n=1 Tax=Klebsiella aerogenes TaxID=548 RepID=UPI00339CAA82
MQGGYRAGNCSGNRRWGWHICRRNIPGAITGGIAGGQVYDWAATKTPDPAMSPSGLGGTLKQKPANLPSEAWNAAAGRECYWSPNNLNDICY